MFLVYFFSSSFHLYSSAQVGRSIQRCPCFFQLNLKGEWPWQAMKSFLWCSLWHFIQQIHLALIWTLLLNSSYEAIAFYDTIILHHPFTIGNGWRSTPSCVDVICFLTWWLLNLACRQMSVLQTAQPAKDLRADQPAWLSPCWWVLPSYESQLNHSFDILPG